MLRSLGLKSIVDAVTLCTSEVVTNAVVHATGRGSLLWLSVGALEVRVTVYDGSGMPPRPRAVVDTGESGRGLHLVAALSDAWGTVRGSPFGPGGVDGKEVWFEVAFPARP
ncbi:ATP-binding protein [Streptomyces sp. N2-109]|uniref:ATP-binding protein n=1 Tax=Streptomyces gossypii TaxID=2883101 RepID=A0ABT2JXQ3_9ACTN|nr:ATP-binding protein [Streptomyces gossypii]